jgi:hypothetical protein
VRGVLSPTFGTKVAEPLQVASAWVPLTCT